MGNYTIVPPDDKLLRPHRVAEILDISRMSVYRLYRDGSLDGLRTSPRNIRIYQSSLIKYLRKLNQPDGGYCDGI